MSKTYTNPKNKNKGLNIRKFGANLMIGIALFLIPSVSFAATIGEINQQIQETQSALSQAKAQKQTLSGEVAAFDSQIGTVEAQIAGTYTTIAKTNREINQTQAQIKQAEADLAEARLTLGDIIQTSYEDQQQSSFEVIAKSKNFSDYVNRSTYLESVQVKITETAQKIVELKTSLEQKSAKLKDDKKKAQDLLRAQSLQQQALANQRAAKNTLLAQAKGSESSYQKTLGDLYAQRAALSTRNNEGIYGGGNNYPYAGANVNGVDPWGFYYRQCTSYAAWHSATYGPVSGAMLSNWGHGHVANGGDWGALGRSHGLNVSTTPTVGAIMSFPYSYYLPYGHVAIVESVNGDGTVNISEYNWSKPYGFGGRSNVNPWNYGAVFIR